MKKKLLIICTLSIALVQSCTTVKRYKNAKYSGELSNDRSLVTLSYFGSKIEDKKDDPKTKSLWDLKDKGQLELLKIFDKRYSSNSDFMATLNNQYFKDDGTEPDLDFTDKNMRMIFSINKKRDYKSIKKCGEPFSPADRIEYLSFSLKLPETNKLEFTKWNKFTTDYGSVDIADVTFSKNLEVDASAGIGIASAADSGGLGVAMKSTVSKTENQKVKYRFVQLNGVFSKQQITMEEEGMREIDLDGNINIDVSMKFKGITQNIVLLDNIIDSDGNFNTPDKLKIKIRGALVPSFDEIPQFISVDLSLYYVYRGVKGRGSKTYYEWDDKVKYNDGCLKKQIQLFSKDEIYPEFYVMKSGINLAGAPAQLLLKIKNRTNPVIENDLVFIDRKSAKLFYDWLENYPCETKDENKSISIGNYDLYFDGSLVTKKIIKETLKEFLSAAKFY